MKENHEKSFPEKKKKKKIPKLDYKTKFTNCPPSTNGYIIYINAFVRNYVPIIFVCHAGKEENVIYISMSERKEW